MLPLLNVYLNTTIKRQLNWTIRLRYPFFRWTQVSLEAYKTTGEGYVRVMSFKGKGKTKFSFENNQSIYSNSVPCQVSCFHTVM